ncbi:MAG: SRPBCC domain-containing protein [Rhizomicrobium sp.]|jgi:uncharacterized protein YndB with AHSA1/START domain
MKILFLAAVVAATPAFAAPDIHVVDTSFRDEAGQRVQQLHVDVDAPVAKVWAALTTDAGFTSWAAPVAHVTLGNDGMIEASYRLSSKIGDPDNIRNQIVAYVPDRLLIIHNVHAPKNGPFKPEVIDKIRTVIELQDLGNGRTRVTESGVGYGEGADFDSMYEHFRSGNAEEFAALAQSFVTGPVDWKAEAAQMNAAVSKPAGK